MDPAGPAFEFWPKKVRLDQNDAEFVDVIHTDAELVFGTYSISI
jgi:triacylglycerol lipase